MSLEQCSNIKKDLRELGDMDPSMQSRKTTTSRGGLEITNRFLHHNIQEQQNKERVVDDIEQNPLEPLFHCGICYPNDILSDLKETKRYGLM